MISIRKHRHKFFLAAFSSVLCLGLSCSDKPVEPVEPKDYPFFISGRNPSQLYVFHPVSRKLDSVAVPWNSLVTVSANGKRVYLGHGTSIAVYNTESFNTITDLPYPHINPVSVSPNNEYLAISGYDLNILRTSDYSLVFSDTIQLLYEDGRFSADGRFFTCPSLISQDSPYVVYQVDLSDSLFPVTRKGFSDGSVAQVVPSIDESKWFLYLNVALWTSAFEVYDVISDSIIFQDVLVPGAGSLEISPDGEYAFYTNASASGTDPPSDLSFRVFDVEANQVSKIISDTSFFCESTSYGRECVAPNLVAVTPDSRWVGILGGSSFLMPGLYLYEIHTSKLVYHDIALPPSPYHHFINITAQNGK